LYEIVLIYKFAGNIKKLNMLTHLVNLSYNRFTIVPSVLQSGKIEDVLGERLHEVISQSSKMYFMQGIVHLFIGNRATSY
jgi:hypothetical protein